MDNKVLPFSNSRRPAKRDSRVIFQIGKQRFAIEVACSMKPLPPEVNASQKGSVLPFPRPRKHKGEQHD